MIDTETYHGIGNSISFRADLTAEVARKLAEQDKRDAEMQERLLQKAPEELREWLSEDGVLATLFRHGKYNLTIDFGDQYGFKNVEDTRVKMKSLRKAWKDVIFIRLGTPDGTPEPYRIPVYLAAVM